MTILSGWTKVSRLRGIGQKEILGTTRFEGSDPPNGNGTGHLHPKTSVPRPPQGQREDGDEPRSEDGTLHGLERPTGKRVGGV